MIKSPLLSAWPLAIAALCATSVVDAAPAPATRDYVVQPGDSCMSIAIRELGGRDQLAVIHALNPRLGPLPHHLRPGQVLKLPVGSGRAADATVTAQHGDVAIQRAGEATWSPSTVDADVVHGWRVGAREHASAQVTFADQSAIGMRDGTIVVLGTSAKPTGDRATLERGTLRSRIAPADGHATVTTPGGIARLGTGSVVIDVDDSHVTRVSNHRGATVKLTSRARTPHMVTLVAGFGAQVEVGGQPTPPHPLPAPPVWEQPRSRLALGWVGAGATLTGSWTGVAAATSYRVELAHDRELTAVDERLEVPASATSFELDRVPAGDYVLAAAAVDAKGFESVPSERVAVRVVEIALPDGAVLGPADAAPIVGLGATIATPAGVTCAVNGGAPGHVVASRVGTNHVVCTAADGSFAAIDAVVLPVPVVAPIVPPRVIAPVPTPTPSASTAAIAVESPASVSPFAIAAFGGGVLAGTEGSHPDRFGVAVRLDAARYLSVDAQAARPLYNVGSTTVEVGASVRLPGLWFSRSVALAPALRFGVEYRMTDEPFYGVYAGVGLELRLDDQLSAIAFLDGIDDRGANIVQAALGLQLRLR